MSMPEIKLVDMLVAISPNSEGQLVRVFQYKKDSETNFEKERDYQFVTAKLSNETTTKMVGTVKYQRAGQQEFARTKNFSEHKSPATFNMILETLAKYWDAAAGQYMAPKHADGSFMSVDVPIIVPVTYVNRPTPGNVPYVSAGNGKEYKRIIFVMTEAEVADRSPDEEYERQCRYLKIWPEAEQADESEVIPPEEQQAPPAAARIQGPK